MKRLMAKKKPSNNLESGLKQVLDPFFKAQIEQNDEDVKIKVTLDKSLFEDKIGEIIENYTGCVLQSAKFNNDVYEFVGVQLWD